MFPNIMHQCKSFLNCNTDSSQDWTDADTFMVHRKNVPGIQAIQNSDQEGHMVVSQQPHDLKAIDYSVTGILSLQLLLRQSFS